MIYVPQTPPLIIYIPQTTLSNVDTEAQLWGETMSNLSSVLRTQLMVDFSEWDVCVETEVTHIILGMR